MPDTLPGETPGRLPEIDGRRLRVGVLVYNDCHADARVLKTAATLHEAGADVRIVGVARARAGFPVGTKVLPTGVELQRVPEFELVKSLPRTAALAKKILGLARPERPLPPVPVTEDAAQPTGRTSPPRSAASPGEPTAQAPTPSSVPDVQPVRKTRTERVKGAASGLWLKTYQVVSLVLYQRGARKALAAWGPDVVHANDANTLAPASRLGVPVVYDSHELWTHRNVRGPRPVARVVERVSERRHARRAAGVVTVSPSIAEWLHRTYRLSAEPVLVRNIPSKPLAPPVPADGRLRSLAGLGPADRVIAYGGRITTSRGIEETLSAMVELPSDVHFVLLGYGEPEYVGPLGDLAERLGIHDRVHLVGRVGPDEVAGALADADVSIVYVRPTCLSYRYSLPNKLFEAIHAGLPIAAADLPDTARIVEDFGVGRVFGSDSPQDLARVVLEVLEQPDEYRAASRAAIEHLSWEIESERLVSLYQDILARRPDRRRGRV